MFWNRIELDDWTLGISWEWPRKDRDVTLHLGPINITWVCKGTQFFNDLKRTRK